MFVGFPTDGVHSITVDLGGARPVAPVQAVGLAEPGSSPQSGLWSSSWAEGTEASWGYSGPGRSAGHRSSPATARLHCNPCFCHSSQRPIGPAAQTGSKARAWPGVGGRAPDRVGGLDLFQSATVEEAVFLHLTGLGS